jgi:hypothetical protein
MRFTDYLAIYASILSTSVFAWNVLQSRPRLKVDVLPGSNGQEAEFQMGIYIFVRNISPQAVHLAAVDILYPYKKQSVPERFTHMWRYRRIPRRIGWVHTSLSFYDVDSECPVSLEPRTSHKIFIPNSAAERILGKASERFLIAHAQDQLWNNAYSRPFRVVD